MLLPRLTLMALGLGLLWSPTAQCINTKKFTEAALSRLLEGKHISNGFARLFADTYHKLELQLVQGGLLTPFKYDPTAFLLELDRHISNGLEYSFWRLKRHHYPLVDGLADVVKSYFVSDEYLKRFRGGLSPEQFSELIDRAALRTRGSSSISA